jgi:hypothetical protein
MLRAWLWVRGVLAFFEYELRLDTDPEFRFRADHATLQEDQLDSELLKLRRWVQAAFATRRDLSTHKIAKRLRTELAKPLARVLAWCDPGSDE